MLRPRWFLVPFAAAVLMAASMNAATFTVTSAADSGVGSLRQAVLDANANPGADTITFAIGSGVQTIALTSGLNITDTLTIDGTTQPGYAGSPVIVLDTAGNDTILYAGGNNTLIKGLVLQNAGTNGYGIYVKAAASGVTIQGNYIGIDVTGTVARPNGMGIRSDGPGTIIGGTTAAARNVISGNTDWGVYASQPGCVIQGNFIGTNATGTAAVANGLDGVAAGANAVIGGTAPGAGNLISGNASTAIYPFGTNITIQGNLIGTDVTGMLAVPNYEGIVTSGAGVHIGGTTAAARNVISGNTNMAIEVRGANGVIEGNFIGPNAAGTATFTSPVGISIATGNGTVIGGTAAGAGNVIAGHGYGIILRGTGNLVQGNFIGTGPTGTTPLANETGVAAFGSTASVIGGTAPGAANIIAFNTFDGISTPPGPSVSTATTFSGNSMFGNGYGINLGHEPNDPGDADLGPNDLQNHPDLTLAVAGAGKTRITGSLNSTPSTAFTVEFFDSAACNASGFGEGNTYLGSTVLNTDAAGNAGIDITFPVNTSKVTATATNPGGSTSEFSNCLTASMPSASINDVTANEGNSGTTSFAFTVTLTPAPIAPVSVSYATANGTATAGSDYNATSGTVTFAAGVTSQTITVQVIGDTTFEPDETFLVNLTNPVGVTIARSLGTGTILNDDASADLAVTKTAAASVLARSNLTYTITVTNLGPGPSTGTTMTDVLPAGAAFVSASPSQGTCSGTATLTCSIGTLANGASATVSVVVTAPTSPGTLTNIATVSGGIADPVAANNSATAVTAVQANAAIPTLSEWVLLALALALALTGIRKS